MGNAPSVLGHLLVAAFSIWIMIIFRTMYADYYATLATWVWDILVTILTDWNVP